MRLLGSWLLGAALATAQAGGDDVFDLVIRGGRVMDPESGTDAVRDVGVTGGRIARAIANRLGARHAMLAIVLATAILTYGGVSKLDWYRKGEVSQRQWADVMGVLQATGSALDRPYLRGGAVELGVSDLLDRALDEADRAGR